MEKKGITATMEVLVALEAECDAVIASCADGKLNLADLRNEIPVIPKARAAFKDAKLIAGELTDVDGAEVIQLYDKVVAVGEKLVEAVAAVAAILAKG